MRETCSCSDPRRIGRVLFVVVAEETRCRVSMPRKELNAGRVSNRDMLALWSCRRRIGNPAVMGKGPERRAALELKMKMLWCKAMLEF